MKKIYAFLFLATFSVGSVVAQTDTLLYENFEGDIDPYIIVGSSPGVMNDTKWYNWDIDGIPDGSAAGDRPNEWFLQYGFATVDSANIVFVANSWTNDPTTPVSNWLITPAISITDSNTTLSWKSAPYQTPRYMDGYKVLISTTDNGDYSFTDTIFVAGEYIAGASTFGNDYSLYTFSEGFIHGADSTYVEENPDAPSNQTGILRPFTYDLSAYVGKTIYIAFVHDTHDDNLLSIDDILVVSDNVTAIKEKAEKVDFVAYPNPASEVVKIKMNLAATSPVSISVYDISGKLIIQENKGFFMTGNHELTIKTASLTVGTYNFVVRAGKNKTVTKLIIK